MGSLIIHPARPRPEGAAARRAGALAAVLVALVVGLVALPGRSAASPGPTPTAGAGTGPLDAAAPPPGGVTTPHLASPTTSLPVATFTVTLVDPDRWTPWRGSTPAHAGRILPTTVVHPTTPGPWPVVGFAHGFATSPAAYQPLLEAMARAGYVVVAPEFPISGSNGGGAPRRDDIPGQPGDVSFALSWAQAAGGDPGSPLFGLADATRLGAVGHSDGGITTAAMALNTATLDGRLRGTAVLAGGLWSIPGGAWGPVSSGAVLVQQGSADTVNPWWIGREPYDVAGPDKVFSTIWGGDHQSAYVDGPMAGTVQAELVAFLDATVRGDARGTARLAGAVAGSGGVLDLESVGLGADPFGNLDGFDVGLDGTPSVRGWVADPDAYDPLRVHVYADGHGIALGTAGAARPDVAAVLPEIGPAVGFSTPMYGLADGWHQICVYGENVGYGTANTLLGCRGLLVDNNPFGNLESIDVDPATGTATVKGWAIDPNTSAPIGMHVYVDGAFRAAATADLDRPDVGAAFPGRGSAHGFLIPLGAFGDGDHQVCVYGLNTLAGTANALVGCRTVAVSRRPFGNLELVAPESPVTPGSRVDLRGWAIDPDTTAPVAIHVYVDGVGAGVLTADVDRPDVGAAFPPAGPAHGFAGSVAVPGHGSHGVCVYAINQGAGAGNVLLGCRTVVMDRNPFGNTDGLDGYENAVDGPDWYLRGWAIDPDSTGAVVVHVYRDGRIAGMATTSFFRGDIAAVWPAYGTAREWRFDLGYTGNQDPGWHELCAYAINQGPGSTNVLLGCLHR